MEDLKPCPFCGNDKIESFPQGRTTMFGVVGYRCIHCCAEIGIRLPSMMADVILEKKKEARDLWNTRKHTE